MSGSAIDCAHYSVEFGESDDGWWIAVCSCGANLGVFPDAETTCDALMEHAYEEGARTLVQPIAEEVGKPHGSEAA